MHNAKKYITYFLFSITLIAYNTTYSTFHVYQAKTPTWSLKQNFLKELVELFNVNVFVETGTYHGDTTNAALPYFNEIHTIELSHHYYQKAKNRFLNEKKVTVHWGNSAETLSTILPQIKEYVLFFLDGHYSSGDTAQGELNTPVLQELQAIQNSNVESPIILIDDIRCFNSPSNLSPDHPLYGYPTVQELQQAIIKINPNYEFKIFGDIALAYPASNTQVVSPTINACTISRLFDNTAETTAVLKAEQSIAESQGIEKETLKNLALLYGQSEQTSRYFILWRGLILAHEGDDQNAYEQFKRAYNFGLNHWRVLWYLATSAYQCNKIEESKKALTQVLTEAPNFLEARDLLDKLSK